MPEFPRYKKLPVEVEAVQFLPNNTGWDWNELTEFFGVKSGEFIKTDEGSKLTWQSYGQQVIVYTNNGPVTVEDGDYILKGIDGEFYPCQSDIFRRTYEPAD